MNEMTPNALGVVLNCLFLLIGQNPIKVLKRRSKVFQVLSFINHLENNGFDALILQGLKNIYCFHLSLVKPFLTTPVCHLSALPV